MARLDYKLTGDTLRRVARAEADIRPKTTAMDVAIDFGEKILKEGEKKGAKVEKWDDGFNWDRPDWASTELFDSFQGAEEQYREQYIEAVRSGDKQLQQKLLKQQGDRSASLKSWQDTMVVAKSVNDDIGWGATVTMSPENKQVLSALAAQDGTARMRMNENMEMLFDIDIIDENGRKTHTKTVKRSEVDSLVAHGMIPFERTEKWNKGLFNIEEAGIKGKRWHNDIQLKTNMDQILPGNVRSMMFDEWAGTTSFADDFLNHPSLRDGYLELADTNNDGKLDKHELGPNAVPQILNAMAEDVDIAKDVVGRWMTLKQKQMWRLGYGKYIESAKEENEEEDVEFSADNDADNLLRGVLLDEWTPNTNDNLNPYTPEESDTEWVSLKPEDQRKSTEVEDIPWNVLTASKSRSVGGL